MAFRLKEGVYVLIVLAAVGLLLASFVNNYAFSAAPDMSAAVSKKVDQVIKNQQDISAKLDAIQEELRIIKIRITQAQ